MPLTSYIPEFPYKGDQIVLTSGRVLLHSKNDSIFLFGKRAVSVSTPGTFNVDASVGVTIAAPKIELGIEATVEGEPVVMGYQLQTLLNALLTEIGGLSEALSKLESNSTGFAKSLPLVVNKAKLLKDLSQLTVERLPRIFSQITYTR